MATIFRRGIVRYLADGRRVTAAEARKPAREGRPVEKRTVRSRRWYIRYRRPDGRLREVRGYTDRMATLALAVELQRNAAREVAGQTTPADRHLADPVDRHLADYLSDMAACGRTAEYLDKAGSRIRAVLAAAGIKRLVELDATRVQAALAALRGRNVALETANHYLVAAKGFTRWLWRQGRLSADVLAGLRRWNPDVDRRVLRRPLWSEELGRLVRTAEASVKAFRGLDGRARAALYLTAAGTGLRARELATLTYGHVLLDAEWPRVLVEAAYSKNRWQDVLPLPPQVADYLRAWLAGRPTVPTDPAARRLWPGTWWLRAASRLRADLAAAGIKYQTPSGRADFDSLRAAYATLLARRGVNFQTAQALLRHSDPKLTARTYTKLGVIYLLVGALAHLDFGLAGKPAEVPYRQEGGVQ